MLMQLSFVRHTLGLAPVFLLVRAAVLIAAPGLRRRTTPLHELGFLVLCLYLSAVCFLTVNVARVLHGQFEMGQTYNITPLREITSIAAGGDTVYALLNIAGNVVLFSPLGFLLPLLWRGWRAGRVFLVSLVLSGGIEVLQLFTGRSADVDDVILNTIGGMAGYFAHWILRGAYPAVIVVFRLGAEPIPRRALEDPARPRGRQSAKGRRRAGKTALAMTAVALCVLGSATLALGAFSGDSVRPGAPPGRRLPDPSPAPRIVPDLSAVRSANVLLASADLSQVLYEEKADSRIYPASMTKIMTAVLALEWIGDMEAVITLRPQIFSDIFQDNLSTAGFQPGEGVRALDLVYGVMLPSGAECAVALAEYVAGSETAFAVLMNDKVRALGMSGTHFVNATGSHHRDHYTTARDMALLLRYALDNPAFRSIAATRWYDTAPTSLHPDGITLTSTLFGRLEGTGFPGGALVGGKTGYTDEAGQCLASFAEIDGREYILVTAGARPADFRTEQLHIEDAITVYGALGEALGSRTAPSPIG